MAINKTDLDRVHRLNVLLGGADDAAIEKMVREEVEHDLLGNDVLDAARVANLVPAVIYLATLGAANLPAPNDRSTWLAVYQSLSGGSEAPGFAQVPESHPIKWITRAIIAGDDARADPAALRRCAERKTPVGEWLAALELAMDRHRFDLVEQSVDLRLSTKTSYEDWMHIACALCVRLEYVKEVWNAAALGRALVRIRAHLPVGKLFDDVRSLLAVCAGEFLMRGGEYRRAISLARGGTTASETAARFMVIAEASCKSGDLASCIEYLDKLLVWSLAPARLEKLKTSFDKKNAPSEPAHGFDVPAASQALADLQRVLDGCRQKAFLVSGTLLGYARDGHLLKHDKDIDVGILRWQDQYDVVAALLKSGLFWVRIPSIGDSQTYYIPIAHLPTHVTTDIFIYHREGDKLVTATPHFYGHTQKFAFTPFTLEPVDFLDTKVYVPSDIDRNLGENFGPGWRIPDPDYLSHLESPSMVDIGGLAFQVTGRLLIQRFLTEGKLPKLRRAIGALRTYQDRVGGLKPDLSRRLEEVCDILAGEAVPLVVAS